MNVLLQILYRTYRIISSLRYRTVRRLTSSGWMVLIGLGAAGVVGIDTENTVAYQAFMPLLLLLVFGMAFVWRFRPKLTVSRTLPRFASVGEPLVYEMQIRNDATKPERDLTLLEDLADPRPSFQQWKALQRAKDRKTRSFRVSDGRGRSLFRVATVQVATLPTLPPGRETEVRMTMTPLRRGAVRFTGVTWARPDPFGLVRGLRKQPLAQSLLVLPKRYPLPPLALPGTMKYQERGVALASSVGQSDEFVALRDYRRGDPLRHIHWRSWAKAGKPIVREFEDEFFVRHALILDTFTAVGSDAFEEAVSVAASFACTIDLQESLLDLLFVGPQAYCFTAGRGLAHSDQMLEILASVSACPEQPFSTLEHLVLEHANVVSGCICVLLTWDAERQAFIQRLTELGLPVLVIVVVEEGRAASLELESGGQKPEHFYVVEVGHIQEGLARLRL